MKRIPILFFLLPLVFLGASTDAAAQKDSAFIFGFADCEPAVFIKLLAPMNVKITNITYAPTGRMIGFREEVVNTTGEHIALIIKIDEKKWNGMCNSLVYTAEIADKRQTSPPYDSFNASQSLGMIAFSPIEPGGVVLGGGNLLEADTTTQLKYDTSGRRLLDTQIFQLQRTSYVIAYTEYNYGPVQLGQHKVNKLLGYTASVSVKK